MAELEATIENKLINQLCFSDSQWTHCKDLRNESDLWENFRNILEQNNKAALNDQPLSESEFEQVKNQISFASFYDAGKWLVGENGQVLVHVQRGNETLHLTVLNQEHISGGTSVYQVINQYQALKDDGEAGKSERNRRFDITLMINGLPMIHIELKNRHHPYMDGFRQIKKYIAEGKFKGIFSTVQMFVVSNAVDTRYFSAARDTELNPKFISCWLDEENNPVPGYLEFAEQVLKIPMAHEMVSKYTVLDKESKKLLLLRPYQIHAIEAMRQASKEGRSGYIWHTTGSGKTMTSYKATRNLLMDIPAIEKTVFLIDRKDLDKQTKMAFQSYADNDCVDVDDTDNVTDLIKKLGNNDRQMIVTTIQKMQIMISRRLTEDHPKYKKIKSLRIAFVVDECHRTITPKTKREFEHFFSKSLWYGFTGTPRFPQNPYELMGDLPRTTGALYSSKNETAKSGSPVKEVASDVKGVGSEKTAEEIKTPEENKIPDAPPLHKYTIKDAVHDEAVLGFQNEYLDSVERGQEPNYECEKHMLTVLNTIVNLSNVKFGIENGKGRTYEAILTTISIERAQKYYVLLKRIKNGEFPTISINEDVKRVIPDFPKFAITYSITENDECSHVNQERMQESLNDYNQMFGTHYGIEQIGAYNANLNDRLARKNERYLARNEQLDLVIVVDRLLTGFDAPCLSTLFVDRPPMQLHDIIQAMSRTNRLFDKRKKFGQIVTFQEPDAFKEAVDEALELFSAGGIGAALAGDWDDTEKAFIAALADLRVLAPTPDAVPGFSDKEKKEYVRIFQTFDSLLTQLRAFTIFETKKLDDYGITQKEYEEYAAHYLNILAEFRNGGDETPGDPDGGDPEPPIDTIYEPIAYGHAKIDYEYIINLIQNIVSSMDNDGTAGDSKSKIAEIRGYIAEFSQQNPKLGNMMEQIMDGIEKDKEAYYGRNISEILTEMKQDVVDRLVNKFVEEWYVDKSAVLFAIENHRNGAIPNINNLKDSINYQKYKESTENPLNKLKARSALAAELEKLIEEEIKPLQIGNFY